MPDRSKSKIIEKISSWNDITPCGSFASFGPTSKHLPLLSHQTVVNGTACTWRAYLLIVIGTPTPETSVTVIWNSWYSRVNAWRSQGVSATA
jgi:hypothetical protein